MPGFSFGRLCRPWSLTISVIIGLVIALTLSSASIPREAVSAASCPSMGVSVYHVVRPADGVSLYTSNANEVRSAATYGFTEQRGVAFRAATAPGAGLVSLHRLYRARPADFVWVPNSAELRTAVSQYGYVDQGPNFAVSTSNPGCLVPVRRYLRNGVHRFAVSSTDQQALRAAGWIDEGVRFYAAAAPVAVPSTTTTTTTRPPTTTTTVKPAPSTTTTTRPPTTTTTPPTTTPSTTTAPSVPASSTFSFAVIPDTQNELYAGEVRMQKRVEWLLANKAGLDLRWVLHSGDVHNWDTPDHDQFTAMSGWLRPLEDAGVPLVMTVGNHDTAAVCPGGSACPGQDANTGLRNTSTWNAYYPPSRFGFEGLFEPGKSDNGWRTFNAGGKAWLILSVELWPRTAVIDWAARVVRDHPRHNVIVLTHAFLEGNGLLSTSNGGYGNNSPAVLWNALDDYPNVVMTFSGHTGAAANTSLTATDGHKVATYLQGLHDPTYNPTRIVTVDTAAGTISTRIVANWNRVLGINVNYEYTAYQATITGMRFVN